MDSFEKIYKEKLQGLEIQTSDKVWSNISKSLIRQRRIKRFFIYCCTTIGIALMLGLGLYLSKKYSTPKDNPDRNNKVIALEPNININKNISKDIIDPIINTQNQNASDIITDNIDVTNTGSLISHNRISRKHYKKPTHLISSLNNSGTIYQNNGLPNQIYDKPLTYKDISDKRKYPEILRLSMLNTNHLRFSQPSHKVFNLKINPQKDILNDCFPSRSYKLFIDFYLSPDYAKKSLTGNKQDYINSRYNSESALLSYSGGIIAGYKFNKEFLIKGGMNFTSINEKFHIVIKDVKNTQTIITIDTIWKSDGTYDISRDTTIKEIYGKEDIQKINRYSMIDIPVIFGYQFKYNNLNLGINAGVVLNILSFHKGTMLNMNGEVETFDGHTDNPNIFNKNLGVSIYTSAYIGYRLNENIELFAEPKFRYFIKPFTNNNYSLTQKFSKFGISFGPRFFIN